MRAAEPITWAGGEHDFRLGIGELRAIEQRCDAGCAVVFGRLLGSQWKIDDVLSPIRLGLIGGGMDEAAARRMVDRVLETASPWTLAITSASIMQKFIMWENPDQPGETVAEEVKA